MFTKNSIVNYVEFNCTNVHSFVPCIPCASFPVVVDVAVARPYYFYSDVPSASFQPTVFACRASLTDDCIEVPHEVGSDKVHTFLPCLPIINLCVYSIASFLQPSTFYLTRHLSLSHTSP